MGETTKKLLVICGPTATGKTKLALHLAKIFNGVLISADSRQVYKYMDIGTGKEISGIYGYDLVRPDEEFSVSEYLKFANNTIKNIIEDGKLPILVGGTGFYIKAVVDGIATAIVAPDMNLRIQLQNKSTDELYRVFKKLDPKKADLMNESDRKNPRRLVRAIEISRQFAIYNLEFTKPDYEILFIGLTMPKAKLKEKIEKRVEERIAQGFEKEIVFLKKEGFWDGAPKRTIGYKDWPDVEKWKIEEIKYAKRQMTWFNKEKRIDWFDVTKAGWLKSVENVVQKWYYLGRNAK